ncbi:MAG: MazG nucleotide pyrophosphohydrolase domain-containing protein [Promethearchaeota archaeon]
MKISDFQILIKNIYYSRDVERGISGTFIWLVEELGELARTIKDQKIDKKRASEEIADVIAWINSLANLLDIDVEEALFDKYPNKCRKCNSLPCRCRK